MKNLSGFGFLFSALLSLTMGLSFGRPAYGAAPVEIAESVPLETTLAVPGIRSTQAVWLDLINSATVSLDLEQFYIVSKPGEALEPVLNAIVAAARRGVQVRFVIDSSFYKSYPSVPNTLSQIPNIEVRAITFTPGIQHAKYFIVDGASVFAGSANFDWLSLEHIHEVGLRVSDNSIAAAMEAIFNSDFAVAKSIKTGISGPSRARPPRRLGTVPLANIQVVASPPQDNPAGIPDTLSAIVRMIGSAQKSLNVQVYEYSTVGVAGGWRVLDNAIRAAAARGVQVRLMVDAVALKAGSADLSALARVPNIHVMTVVIPQWSGGPIQFARLIHSKYLTVDGVRAWVGSENWRVSYFTNTRNVGLVFADAGLVGELDTIFGRVWTSAYGTSL
jgi:phosphatidylserine/phosphatidylglycerophosphate/cardiolipin synthase-like enzyme